MAAIKNNIDGLYVLFFRACIYIQHREKVQIKYFWESLNFKPWVIERSLFAKPLIMLTRLDIGELGPSIGPL